MIVNLLLGKTFLQLTHALIDLQDKITLVIKNNNFCIGIFMDLSKAFDFVDQSTRLSK